MRTGGQAALIAALMLFAAPGAAQSVDPADNPEPGAGEQFIPAFVYRTGPYAAGGSGFFGGFLDYFTLINERDGGIGGIRLVWEECETAYNVHRGLRCYERLKHRGGILHPLSTEIAYALLPRLAADRIPMITLGYGRADASDGRVFPWVFPLFVNYWSQNTAIIRFIAGREGGLHRLRGRKIAIVYIDNAYGRETLGILNAQAERFGFVAREVPVEPPGLDQRSVWRALVRDFAPDWVILRGWGVMNPMAIREAARAGFPRERMVSVWWGGAEEDVIPAGRAAKGYIAAGFHPSGRHYPVVRDILEQVYGAFKGNIALQRVGSTYYIRGLIAALVTAEAIRTAQARYGQRPLSGEELRWGIETLSLTAERLRLLGADGIVPPITVTCRDHEGGGRVKFQQWDGDAWTVISDWIEPDRAMLRPMVEASALAFARAHGRELRTGQSMGSDCGR